VAAGFRELWIAMMMVGIPEKHRRDAKLPGLKRQKVRCKRNSYDILRKQIESLPTFAIANAPSSEEMHRILNRAYTWIGADCKVSCMTRIRSSLNLSDDFFLPFSDYGNLLRMNFRDAMAFNPSASPTDSANYCQPVLQNFRSAQKSNSQRCSFDALQHIKARLFTTS
jgi:hypothetical protein